MEPLGLEEPVQEGVDILTASMEDLLQGQEQKQEPSTLPPLIEPQENGSATSAAEDQQSTNLEPTPAPSTDTTEHIERTQGASTARAEHNNSPIPTAGTTTMATPRGKPRPTLQGTLIGLFVAIDPATQRGKVNVKRELENMGIYQRDLAPTEEVQLSLEQAFYLVADLKRLEVYLPSPSPFQQQEQEEEEVEDERQEGHAMELGNGKTEEQRRQYQQEEEEEEDVEEMEEMAAATEPTENTEPRALSAVECWKAFRTASHTFVKSVGSYRYFREQGFVVHGGLNLGLDFMLYRGTPQRYHAEFGVLLRYPPSAPPSPSSFSEGKGKGGGGWEGGRDENDLSWRDLHLLYRLIGEVRKTLVLGHVRLGKLQEKQEEEEEEEGGAVNREGGKEDEGPAEHDKEARQEMQQWYCGLSVYEVAVTPWRAGTPLARLKMSKQKGNDAQAKRGGGQAGGKKRRRGEGEKGGEKRGRGSEAEEEKEEHPSKRQYV